MSLAVVFISYLYQGWMEETQSIALFCYWLPQHMTALESLPSCLDSGLHTSKFRCLPHICRWLCPLCDRMGHLHSLLPSPLRPLERILSTGVRVTVTTSLLAFPCSGPSEWLPPCLQGQAPTLRQSLPGSWWPDCTSMCLLVFTLHCPGYVVLPPPCSWVLPLRTL